MSAAPLLPWIGGKRRLARFILPLFPAHTCYCEPFCGAAALFFLKAPSKVEVINDVNGDLVNLYRVVKHHLEEFVRQFKWALSSRQLFEWTKATPSEVLTDIQRAARFYYLQQLAFGGRVTGRTFGTATTAPARLNLLRMEEELSQAHLRLARTVIEHLEWHECVDRYDRPHTLFYCDPPYWQTEGYGVAFGLEQYDRLADLLRTSAGKMVVSVNDVPAMRKAFRGLAMDRLEIQYAVGGGTRKRRSTGELVVRNF